MTDKDIPNKTPSDAPDVVAIISVSKYPGALVAIAGCCGIVLKR